MIKGPRHARIREAPYVRLHLDERPFQFFGDLPHGVRHDLEKRLVIERDIETPKENQMGNLFAMLDKCIKRIDPA
jgi:hypothetical protein